LTQFRRAEGSAPTWPWSREGDLVARRGEPDRCAPAHGWAGRSSSSCEFQNAVTTPAGVRLRGRQSLVSTSSADDARGLVVAPQRPSHSSNHTRPGRLSRAETTRSYNPEATAAATPNESSGTPGMPGLGPRCTVETRLSLRWSWNPVMTVDRLPPTTNNQCRSPPLLTSGHSKSSVTAGMATGPRARDPLWLSRSSPPLMSRRASRPPVRRLSLVSVATLTQSFPSAAPGCRDQDRRPPFRLVPPAPRVRARRSFARSSAADISRIITASGDRRAALPIGRSSVVGHILG